jgi:hypothetical protein
MVLLVALNQRLKVMATDLVEVLEDLEAYLEMGSLEVPLRLLQTFPTMLLGARQMLVPQGQLPLLTMAVLGELRPRLAAGRCSMHSSKTKFRQFQHDEWERGFCFTFRSVLARTFQM